MQPQKQTNIPVLALSPLVQGKVFGIPEEDVQKRGPQWSPCQRPGSSWVMRNVKLMLRKALLFLLSSFMVTVAHMPTSLVLLWRWGHRQAVHRRTRGWFLPTIWGPSHRGGVLGEILNFPSIIILFGFGLLLTGLPQATVTSASSLPGGMEAHFSVSDEAWFASASRGRMTHPGTPAPRYS